jgi:hypothetical protein
MIINGGFIVRGTLVFSLAESKRYCESAVIHGIRFQD